MTTSCRAVCLNRISMIAKITLEHFPSREEAASAEKVAIQTEAPRHNIHWWVTHIRPSKPAPKCIKYGTELNRPYRTRIYCHPCRKIADREKWHRWHDKKSQKENSEGFTSCQGDANRTVTVANPGKVNNMSNTHGRCFRDRRGKVQPVRRRVPLWLRVLAPGVRKACPITMDRLLAQAKALNLKP